ncbi:MBL fold metallo-hydrolase [Streptomyces sp. NPDC005760]|uniref:MBL fold metallo-hydrolase n=1 Tax=Streptomyces sp. NPDC005760 TaxID=3156718 RepID=UPI0033D7FB77
MTMPQHTAMTKSWRIGEMTVHQVAEVPLRGFGRWLLPQATPEVVAETPWLHPSYADAEGQLLGSVNAFAVEIGGRRVLVDTAVGNDKSRPFPAWDHLTTPFMEALAAVGFTPENVDLVINTHFHADHVGWNTRLVGDTWQPTFTNARYVSSQAEHDYWAGIELSDDEREMFQDSIEPVRASGRLTPVEVPADGTVVTPGVRLLPAPGHTPGQSLVRLESGGRSAVISADCMHHPVQFVRTAMCSTVDVDPDQATRTRQALFSELAKDDTVLFGSHFDGTVAGLVQRDGDSYRFSPVDPSV